MILSDKSIVQKMGTRISPFFHQQMRAIEDRRCISYGLSSAGYDVRMGRSIMTQIPGGIVDPMIGESPWRAQRINGIDGAYVLTPGECILAVTMELIDMPDDVMALCIGKSTYARCGLLVNATPIEPGWRGFVTLELSNVSRLPIRIYAEQGIAQLVFCQLDAIPLVTYNTRGGKYQDQPAAPVPPRM